MLPYTGGTPIARLLGVRNYLNNYFVIYTRLTCSRICVELASPGYMGFGFHLIINLIPHDHLCDFLFYVELAFPGYLGFGDLLCINLLFPPVCMLLSYR